MAKRIISFILTIILTFCLFGCKKEESTKTTDDCVIVDNTFKIGLLLCSDSVCSNKSNMIKSGFNFAHSQAYNVNIDEVVTIKTKLAEYSSASDVSSATEELIDFGVGAVVFDGCDLDSLKSAAELLDNANIPVISLSSYSCEFDNVFKLTLNSTYLSSCAATYALEKGYNNCAIILESDNTYFSDFANVYKSTLNNYTGIEPTVYYISGENANYTPAVIAAGNYDYLFLISSSSGVRETVSELRSSNVNSEIMLTEILDKTPLANEEFNNCSFLSKLEVDSANNISTVFYDSFSEYSNLKTSEISPAVSYGYDAYMTVFEALKTFANKSPSSIFSNTEPTGTSATLSSSEIKGSDITDALTRTVYLGVTDIITFKDNSSVPTYIYVNNISNGDIVFKNKYTFNSDTKSVE